MGCFILCNSALFLLADQFQIYYECICVNNSLQNCAINCSVLTYFPAHEVAIKSPNTSRDSPKNTKTFILILYRIKRKVVSFHFLKESFTNLLILYFEAYHGAFQIPIDLPLFYVIKSGGLPRYRNTLSSSL